MLHSSKCLLQLFSFINPPKYQTLFHHILFFISFFPFPSLSVCQHRVQKHLMASISPRKLRSDLYSFSQEDPNTPLVISVLASLLDRSIARNERVPRKCNWGELEKNCKRVGVFNSYETLDLTVQSFLERIYRYAHVAPQIYVVAYIYIDRMCQFHPGFQITGSNVHRLLITTIMVASKFVEDMNYRNSYFARVGGLTTEEINKLEVDFLFLMNFKLHVNVSVFDSYCCHLEREVSIGGGYQIERTLVFMCSRRIQSSQNEERGVKHLQHFVGCSSH